ncbi:MAG TPA: trypsin-like peptidase domain-containing protein, partial [Rugosimonospora sp.]|nr:trypsin-like peptidase domain-containing protein [Rugosimonospora sp.]
MSDHDMSDNDRTSGNRPDTAAVTGATAGPARAGRGRLGRFLRSRTTALLAGALAIALVAGVVGGIVGHRIGQRSGTASASSCGTVAQHVLPSVVTLTAQAAGGGGAGTGSGEIIRDGGYVLTNEHVISPALGGGRVDVLTSDGSQYPATLVGQAALVDLAVLRVAGGDLPTIGFGHSADLRVGQPVVALGAPLGLSGTVTAGIVSALGRDVPLPESGGQNPVLVEAIQTDAAINPGNSGGPLVDCSGRLVGVNTAGASPPGTTGNVGLGFAIPVDFARQVADEIIRTGTFTPGFLGLSAVPLPATSPTGGGLFVQSVATGGPASGAGLEPGDVVTHLDGTP